MVGRYGDAHAPGLGDQLGGLLDRLGPAVGRPPLARAAARAVDGCAGGAQLDRDAAPGPATRPANGLVASVMPASSPDGERRDSANPTRPARAGPPGMAHTVSTDAYKR